MVAGTPSEIGEIKRDLGAIIQALGIVGGGGSPNELRSDVGVQVEVGVEETLSRHPDLLTWETINTNAIAGAADTTATAAAFSFAEDTFIGAVTLAVTASPANVAWMALTAHDPASGTARQIIAFVDSTELITLTGGSIQMQNAPIIALNQPALTTAHFPMFVKAGVDFRLEIRSNAGGGFTGQLYMTITRTPKGVPIPH